MVDAHVRRIREVVQQQQGGRTFIEANLKHVSNTLSARLKKEWQGAAEEIALISAIPLGKALPVTFWR